MAIKRVGHVVLKMRDLEVAKQFYAGVLGMKISSESEIAVFFRFDDYHHDIGVFKTTDDAEAPKENQVGLLHIALVVDSPESLVAMKKHLEANGVEIAAAFDHGMTNSIYIYDPEGNSIEIYCEVPSYDWKTNDDFVGYLKPIEDVDALV